MPDLVEKMYCSQQINIPPNLPYILKQYAKAAIRTQPQDLLFWSAAYFRAKAENLPPPVKERIEYPPIDTPSGLSPGFLKVLHKQLGQSETVKRKVLYDKWLGVCLKEESLTNMLRLGKFNDNISWLNFLAIAAGYLCPKLSRTMILICEILTEEPDGGSAMIPVETFNSLYTYLAQMNCGHIKTVEQIPSETSTKVSTVTDGKTVEEEGSVTAIKDGVMRKGSDIGQDSHAGLMVWPDIEPSEESSQPEPSPRPEDEGATSEDGLLVVDDITKPPDETQVIVKTQVLEKPQALVQAQDLDKPQALDQTQILDKPQALDQTQVLDTPHVLNETEVLETPAVSYKNSTVKALNTPFSKAIQLVYVESEEEASNLKQGEHDNEVVTSDEQDVSRTSAQANNMPSGRELGGEKHDESVVLASNISGQRSIHDIEEGAEFIPQLDSTHLEQELQPVSEIEVPADQDKNKTKTSSDAEVLDRGGASGEVLDNVEYDMEKEISSLPSTEYMGLITATGEILGPDESVKENLPVETKSISSESKSFIILDEEPYFEEVVGIGPVIPEKQIHAVTEYMKHCANKQEGMVMPRNVLHFLCPPLDHSDILTEGLTN